MKIFRVILCVLLLSIGAAVSLALSDDGPPPIRRRSGPPVIPTSFISTNDVVLAVAADLRQVNADERYLTRYLSLHDKPAEERIKWIQTINYLVNSLSRARIIRHVYVVPGTQNSVLRLYMRDYQFYDEDKDTYIGWDPKVWEQLGELDVYFNSFEIKTEQEVIIEEIKKEKKVPTGRKIYYSNGYGSYRVEDEYAVETIIEKVQKPGKTIEKRIRGVIPGVDKKTYNDIQRETKSAYPILRGDFFNARASLPPFYYDFLAFGKTVDDFLNAVILSKDDIRRAQLEVKGVVVKSGAGFGGRVIPVSENNRFISRTQGPYGYVWRTKDVIAVKDFNDYLRRLKDDNFDASEWIAVGRCGLQWYFLSNNKDERQDEAPINIVRDDTNVDRRVRNGRSCITCHLRGINEFVPLPQEMIKYHIDIISPDSKAIKKLQETFIGNLDKFFADDNRVFASAVASATSVYVGRTHYDLDPETNARQFGAFYNAYFVQPIDLQRASYELGVPSKDLMVILDGAKNDPYLKGLARNQPLFSVPRVHWERSFQQAALLVAEAKGLPR